MFLSGAMMIITLNSNPYQNNITNLIESFNEFCILIVCYHLMVVSDFVPKQSIEEKIGSGYSMVIFVTFISVTYLFYILIPLFFAIIEKMRELIFGKREKVKEIDPKIQKEIDFLLTNVAEIVVKTA